MRFDMCLSLLHESSDYEFSSEIQDHNGGCNLKGDQRSCLEWGELFNEGGLTIKTECLCRNCVQQTMISPGLYEHHPPGNKASLMWIQVYKSFQHLALTGFKSWWVPWQGLFFLFWFRPVGVSLHSDEIDPWYLGKPDDIHGWFSGLHFIPVHWLWVCTAVSMFLMSSIWKPCAHSHKIKAVL